MIVTERCPKCGASLDINTERAEIVDWLRRVRDMSRRVNFGGDELLQSLDSLVEAIEAGEHRG